MFLEDFKQSAFVPCALFILFFLEHIGEGEVCHDIALIIRRNKLLVCLFPVLHLHLVNNFEPQEKHYFKFYQQLQHLDPLLLLGSIGAPPLQPGVSLINSISPVVDTFIPLLLNQPGAQNYHAVRCAAGILVLQFFHYIPYMEIFSQYCHREGAPDIQTQVLLVSASCTVCFAATCLGVAVKMFGPKPTTSGHATTYLSRGCLFQSLQLVSYNRNFVKFILVI